MTCFFRHRRENGKEKKEEVTAVDYDPVTQSVRTVVEPEVGTRRTVDTLALEPLTDAELHLIIGGVNTIGSEF